MSITEQLNNLLATIINILIIPILPVLTAFIIAYIKKKTEEMETGMKNTAISQYSRMAEDAVNTAVTAVNQVFVDNIKQRSLTLTPYEQKAAFGMAKERALRIIGDDGAAVLKGIYKDFDAWLENRIEYYVKLRKIDTSNSSGDPELVFVPENDGGMGGEP